MSLLHRNIKGQAVFTGRSATILLGSFVMPTAKRKRTLPDQPVDRQPRGEPASRSLAQPRGELASRSLAMPTDPNPRGHVVGGWIMSLMDCAGKMTATHHAGGRVVTAAVSNIAFLQPVQVGDTVCCYTDLIRLGRTSITLGVEVWVLRQGQGERIKVTDAEFTFVAVAEDGTKRKLPAAQRAVRTA
jgi:acyl-CoA thioesterase YciA